jgi:hypothetical protein
MSLKCRQGTVTVAPDSNNVKIRRYGGDMTAAANQGYNSTPCQ